MSRMGGYCKAYPIARLHEFPEWSENLQNLRTIPQQVEGTEREVKRELTADDFFYVQEDFTVTDGIFIDENIIFDNVTPEWIEFCKNTLKFEIPVYESDQSNEGQEEQRAE